jgi:F-type H+-transporting ATPase subunit delta
LKKVKGASKYAKALLRNVGMDKAAQAIAELSSVSDLMVKSREFGNLLVNPRFTAEERNGVIKALAGRLNLSDSTVKFILSLAETGVISGIADILRIATDLYLERQRKVKAIVTSPIEISKDREAVLKASLKKMTERDVDLEYVVDPSLLGGVLVRIGSTMYDTSIRGQLRLLKDELIKG